MKKLLLAAVALSTLSLNASAVTRMTLHEEFTGENCGPCATTNPTFWALCNGSGNPSKLIHISYMVPIPSSGFYCARTSAIHTARTSYYSVPFAPYGRYDGHVPNPGCSGGSSAGHPGCFTQADIDAEAAIASPFTITVTNTWDATFSNVNTSVTITCPGGWTGSGTTPSVKLRAALVKTDDFATPPGSNGESHFENVVQAMYPDVNGTSLPTTWTAGESHTYTLTGAVPTWVDKSQSPYMVVWVQDDNDKSIQQAAKATPLPSPTIDVAANGTTGQNELICATGTYNATHSVVIKNSGTSTLTTAKVFYKADAGAWLTYDWSGSLAAAATQTVSIPAVAITVTGSAWHTIIDSVGMPNATADVNLANSKSGLAFFIENTNGAALPYGTSFEATDTSYYVTDNANNGATWYNLHSTSSTSLAHSGNNAYGFELGYYPAGSSNVLILPEVNVTSPATTGISYWVAYGKINPSSADLLDVVYSTDCGSTWNTITSFTPTMTLDTSSINFLVPNSPTKYKKYSTLLSSVSAGSTMLGFRCTKAGGNSLWLDDINIASAVAVTNVNNVTAELTVFPNPTKDEANVSFNLTGSSEVSVQVVDNLGRIVSKIASEKMEAGMHTVSVNTSNLPTGIYNVVVNTNGGSVTEKLSVIK